MPTRELKVALAAAEAARDVIRAAYGRDLAVRTKADASPVTLADERAEAVIRDVLLKAFPGYGFYGEEGGREAMDAESVWLVDPIDGTQSFIRRMPFFSTQIALMRAGELVLGVSMASEYGEVAYAEKGGGANLNDAPAHVSRVSTLAEAFLSTGNVKTLARSPAWSALGQLIGAARRTRGYGDFAHYHLLARGALDAVIESDVNILDIAALVVVVREAGGSFTDLTGAPVDLATTSVLATNGALHAPILAALAEPLRR
jgi:histidinol-phosphatase